MSKYVAVQGCTLSFRNSSHSGTITITSIPSIKVKAVSNGVYKGTINISISNGTDGTVYNASGSGTITATATKTKSDNEFILRIDDESSTITMTGIKTNDSPPPPTITGTYTTTVYISDAGQTKVRSN
jgi:hypothetical protein